MDSGNYGVRMVKTQTFGNFPSDSALMHFVDSKHGPWNSDVTLPWTGEYYRKALIRLVKLAVATQLEHNVHKLVGLVCKYSLKGLLYSIKS